MGGRGSRSYSQHHVLEGADDLPYSVISFDSVRGGAVYPFLEKTNRAWHLLTRPADALPEYHPAHTFDQQKVGEHSRTTPTLRWVNGENVNDLFVDGLDTEAFLAESGLALDMHKGGFVLSKRLSRIMRPYRVQGWFAEMDAPTIAYMQQSEAEAKVWDGAGLISRRMLEKLTLSDGLSPSQRERLTEELQHAQRVEFTVMTVNGQDKGHCMVADDLRDDDGNSIDFLLPKDTKRDVKLTDAGAFVGVNFVHGHDHMRLDIQSLINLHPFFDNDQLLAYLRDEGELFVESIQTGQVGEVMGRIDPHETARDVSRWPLKAYFAAGGQPNWFRAHVKSLFGQHLKRLNHQQLEKMRLPLAGGRHYVMPAVIGRRAGYEIDVGRGEIQIDPQRSTAWVNDADWLALQDSPDGSGIADILGGADNDDALWLHPFTDHDGERKVLAWRSPNQLGEFLTLRPTMRSAELAYATASGGHVRYPQADSRKLPPRIDQTQTTYLNLVDSSDGLEAVDSYSVHAMETTIQRAVANAGGLGMYCNSLMLNKALFNSLPADPPAPLEEIIDSAVKTGADLSAVVQWNYGNTRQILEAHTPIPDILRQRLSIDRTAEKRPPRPRMATDHWLSELHAGVQKQIAWVQTKRDELVRQAQPPQAMFDAVAEDELAMAMGRGLNAVFSAEFNKRDQMTPPLDRARAAAESYLSHFKPETQQRILLGALASVYADENASDAVAWLAGSDESEWFAEGSIARRTIVALQQIGVLQSHA